MNASATVGPQALPELQEQVERIIAEAARQGASKLRDLHPVATRCGKCGRCAHQLLQQNQPETGTASVNTAL